MEANKIQEVIRDDLLDQIYEKANHFEWELVEKEGAYWGDIYILEQFGKQDLNSQVGFPPNFSLTNSLKVLRSTICTIKVKIFFLKRTGIPTIKGTY